MEHVCIRHDLEASAKVAANQYHDAIRQQKERHWNEFLADKNDIWKAAKYLKAGDYSAFARMGRALLTMRNRQRSRLPSSFLCFRTRLTTEGDRPQRAVHTREGDGVGHCGNNLPSSRDVWASSHQPLRRPETTVSSTGAHDPLRADLHRLVRSQDPQLRELRRQMACNGVFDVRLLQRMKARGMPVLLRADGNDADQRTHD